MLQQASKTFFKTSAVAALLLLPGTPSPVLAQQTPFVAEIMYAGFNFPPKGWAFCNGQTLAINTNTALFSLLGTTFGGDGTSNFKLPDMQGRVPLHQGQGPGLPSYTMGQNGGSQSATLLASNLPAHVHTLSLTAQIPASSAAATGSAPAASNLANTGHNLSYSTSAPNVSMSSLVSVSGTTGNTGSSSPFSIMPPYLVVNCNIALVGIFPSRN